jgi:hypothetical protein
VLVYNEMSASTRASENMQTSSTGELHDNIVEYDDDEDDMFMDEHQDEHLLQVCVLLVCSFAIFRCTISRQHLSMIINTARISFMRRTAK